MAGKRQTVSFGGKDYDFPAEANDDQIRKALMGEIPGVDLPNARLANLPGPARPPLPAGINQPQNNLMDFVRSLPARAPNVISGASTGAGLGALGGPFSEFTVPGGAVAGGVGGLFMKPSQNPGLDTGAAIGGAAANLIPEFGAANRGARLLRGLLSTGAQVGGGYLGDMLDTNMNGGVPLDGAHGKLMFYGGTSAALNGLKSFFGAPFNAVSPLQKTANELESSTGTQMPLSLQQRTGRFQGFGNAVSPRALQMEQNQIKAANDVLEKVSGAPLSATEKIVGSANEDLRAVLKRQYGEMLDEWKQSKIDAPPPGTPSRLLNEQGTPAFVHGTPSAPTSDMTWEEFLSTQGLTEGQGKSLQMAINQPSERWLDQYLTGTGRSSSPALYRMNATLKVLPEEQKGDLATALTLRAIDKSGVMIPTEDGFAMNASGLQQMLKNGVLKKVLPEEQFDALQKLADITTQIGKTDLQEPSGQIIRYLGNKTAFTIMGNLGGAAAGSEMAQGHARSLVGGILGSLGATAVMTKMSTMISAVMHNPDAINVLQRVAKGDTSSVDALVRILAGIGNPGEQGFQVKKFNADEYSPGRVLTNGGAQAPPLANFGR